MMRCEEVEARRAGRVARKVAEWSGTSMKTGWLRRVRVGGGVVSEGKGGRKLNWRPEAKEK